MINSEDEAVNMQVRDEEDLDQRDIYEVESMNFADSQAYEWNDRVEDGELELIGGIEKDLLCCLGNCKDGDATGGDWKADRICGERQVQFQTPYVAGVGVQQAVGIWNHTGQTGRRVAP